MFTLIAKGLGAVILLALSVSPGNHSPPVAGASCASSDHTLGETWLPKSTQTASQKDDIVNIRALKSKSTGGVIGWIYSVRNGQAYVEGKYDSEEWKSIAALIDPHRDPTFMNGGDLLLLSKKTQNILVNDLATHDVQELDCFSGSLDLQST